MYKKNWFGPSKSHIWQQLSRELEGDFIKGGWFKKDKVQVYHKEWTITYDSFARSSGNTSVPFTRIRAPYVNRDDFVFKVFRKQFFHGIGKLFGMQDSEVGFPAFDDAFIIQGNDTHKLKMLFDHEDIRDIMHLQPNILMCIKEDKGWFERDFPKGVNELYFECRGIIKDLDQLYDLYDLFAIILDRLCEIGTAYEDRPNYDYD